MSQWAVIKILERSELGGGIHVNGPSWWTSLHLQIFLLTVAMHIGVNLIQSFQNCFFFF